MRFEKEYDQTDCGSENNAEDDECLDEAGNTTLTRGPMSLVWQEVIHCVQGAEGGVEGGGRGRGAEHPEGGQGLLLLEGGAPLPRGGDILGRHALPLPVPVPGTAAGGVGLVVFIRGVHL